MTMSRSALRIAAATFGSMSMPAWPTYDGCRLSRWSWRRNAATTGRSNAAANLPTLTAAGSLHPPPPSTSSGRSAALNFALRRVIWPAEGARAGGCAGAPSLASARANRTSSGRPRTTGPGRPERRRVEGARHEFGNALGLAHDADPIGDAAEHRLEVDFLEGTAALVGALDQPDEKHHRRSVVVRHIHPARGVRGARRARDECDSRHARQLAGRLRHHRRAALVAADDGADRRRVEQGIERGDEALAGHREQRGAALADELIDQDLAPGTHHGRFTRFGRFLEFMGCFRQARHPRNSLKRRFGYDCSWPRKCFGNVEGSQFSRAINSALNDPARAGGAERRPSPRPHVIRKLFTGGEADPKCSALSSSAVSASSNCPCSPAGGGGPMRWRSSPLHLR